MAATVKETLLEFNFKSLNRVKSTLQKFMEFLVISAVVYDFNGIYAKQMITYVVDSKNVKPLSCSFNYYNILLLNSHP